MLLVFLQFLLFDIILGCISNFFFTNVIKIRKTEKKQAKKSNGVFIYDRNGKNNVNKKLNIMKHSNNNYSDTVILHNCNDLWTQIKTKMSQIFGMEV